MEELQVQNESLIAVIRDMKREMEEMAGQADHGRTGEGTKEGKGVSRR